MEPCPSFKPWHDKTTGTTSLRPTDAKCLHYYFYFIDRELGLCYLRVPTWAPFRLQFYFNGHNYLASRLREEGIDCALCDNAFVHIADFERAQQLAELRPERLHRLLDRLARQYCPVVARFSGGYHWSLMQVEYATDILWQRPADLKPLYDVLVRRTAVHAVRAEEVATFLGRKLSPQYAGEAGTDFHTRVEGTRIKHAMGKVSIKMYDKLGWILRIETTANDVTFFRHHRRVEHRDGTWETKVAQVKKSIYSLPALTELMGAANLRYLETWRRWTSPPPACGTSTGSASLWRTAAAPGEASTSLPTATSNSSRRSPVVNSSSAASRAGTSSECSACVPIRSRACSSGCASTV
jgi:hypothetical protein